MESDNAKNEIQIECNWSSYKKKELTMGALTLTPFQKLGVPT